MDQHPLTTSSLSDFRGRSMRISAVLLIAAWAILMPGCSSDDSPTDLGGDPGPTEAVVLNYLAVAVNAGGSQVIQITTENGEAYPSATVISQDPAIASVEKSGSSFTVTGESFGKTTIELRDGVTKAVLKELPTTVYDHTVLDVGDMLIKVIDDYEFRWNDAGSGNDVDLAVYHPVAPPGFYSLGSVAIPNWADPGPPNTQFAVIVVKEDPTASGTPAIAQPDSYQLVRNIGYSRGGSIWRPVPPPGYKALGLVMSTGANVEPGLDEVRCVREDLTFPTDQSAGLWAQFDFPSGFLVFDSPTLPTSEEDDIGRIASRSFRISSDGSTFIGESSVLRLDFPLIADAHSANWPSNTGDVLPAYLPNLTGQVIPQNPYAPPVLTKTMLVPLMAVSDPDPRYNLAWRVENSPFYQVERNVGYELVDCVTSGGEGFTTTITTDVGSETTQVETFSEETSWSISSSAGVALKAFSLGVSGTFSKTFGYSSSTELSEFESKQVEQPVTVPDNGIGCYWNVQSVFTVRRHIPDGLMTDVSNTGSILENGNVHVDSWP